LSLAQARLLARHLSQEIAADDDAETFIQLAFEHVLAREPTNDEMTTCREFLTQQTELLSDGASLTAFTAGGAPHVAPSQDPKIRARENLVHVLLNHNDFVTLR
jgi:hypothetical protein